MFITPTPPPHYKRGFKDEVYQIIAGLEGHGFSYGGNTIVFFAKPYRVPSSIMLIWIKTRKVRCKCCMYLLLPSTGTFRPFELYENEEFQPLTCFVSFAHTNSYLAPLFLFFKYLQNEYQQAWYAISTRISIS